MQKAYLAVARRDGKASEQFRLFYLSQSTMEKSLLRQTLALLFLLFARTVVVAQDATLTVDDVVMSEERQATISLNITGATQFNGAGMYIVLPEGFDFIYNEEEESYIIGGDVLAKSHYPADKLQSDGTLKFAITSTMYSAFIKDNGTLASATISCDTTLAAGVYEGMVKTIEFLQVSASGLYTLDDISFKIYVGTTLRLSQDFNLSVNASIPESFSVVIDPGVNFLAEKSSGATLASVNLDMDISTTSYAQILSATDSITITGDLSERIYTQGMTWNFLSLPFDCDLSRLEVEDGSAFATTTGQAVQPTMWPTATGRTTASATSSRWAQALST